MIQGPIHGCRSSPAVGALKSRHRTTGLPYDMVKHLWRCPPGGEAYCWAGHDVSGEHYPAFHDSRRMTEACRALWQVTLGKTQTIIDPQSRPRLRTAAGFVQLPAVSEFPPVPVAPGFHRRWNRLLQPKLPLAHPRRSSERNRYRDRSADEGLGAPDPPSGTKQKDNERSECERSHGWSQTQSTGPRGSPRPRDDEAGGASPERRVKMCGRRLHSLLRA